MPLQSVEFNGLAALTADELALLGDAIDASDCILDDGSIKGRSGYRNALGSGAAIAASGNPQGIFRHHASPTEYRTIVACDGVLYKLTDPLSESEYGSADAGTAKFGQNDHICAAQLGKYLYLASDALQASGETYPLVRVAPDGTYETVSPLPRGEKPTHQSTLGLGSVVRFQDKWPFTYSAGVTVSAVSAGSYTCYYVDRNHATGFIAGDYVQITLDADHQDWRPYSHIVLMAAPCAYDRKGATPINVYIGDDSATTVWRPIGSMYGTSSLSGPYAPDIWVFDLRAVESSVLDGVKYLKFEAAGDQVLALTGYYLVPHSPGVGDHDYRTTFYSSAATVVESQPTETLTVTLERPSSSDFPLVICAQMNNYTLVLHTVRVDPTSLPTERVGNYWTMIEMPTIDAYAGAPVIRQAIPTELQDAGTCRFWRMTETGWRLIKDAVTWTTPTTTVDLTDDQGVYVLSHEKYEATGAYSRATSMSARDGRLILGYENRMYISGFVGPGQTTDPVPQFPPIADDEADGWSFDIAPSAKEQIMAIVNGDQLYVGTTEAVYAMDDVKPSSAFQAIMRRGVISRRGMVFVEDMCIWAARDGVYAVQGRVNAGWDTRTPTEMTQQVRRLYLDWLVPTSSTVLAYRERKLYVISGAKFLRYDFVRRSWVRGTFAHTIVDAEEWLGPQTQDEQCWLLTSDRKVERIQDDLTADDATPIPAWTYRSGYVRGTARMRLSRVIIDPTGTVTVTAYKGADAGADTRSVVVSPRADGVEVEVPLPSDLAAYKWGFGLAGGNDVQVRAMFVNVVPVEGAGGG